VIGTATEVLRRQSEQSEIGQRVSLVIALLQKRYRAADVLVRSVLNDPVSFSDSIERIQEIRLRETNISELDRQRNALKQRYHTLTQKQKGRGEEAQQEAQKYADENAQIDALRQTREGKLMEAAKASELTGQADALEREIQYFTQQRGKLEDDQIHQKSRLRSEAEGNLGLLKKEIATAQSAIAASADENADIEREFESVRQGFEQLKQERDQVLDTYRSTKAQYQRGQATLAQISGSSNAAIFDDARFLTFLSDMIADHVSPESLARMVEEISVADQEIQKIEGEIALMETTQSAHCDRMQTKISEMDRIGDELRAISERLHEPGVDGARPKVEYTQGASNISMDGLEPLPDDMNRLVLFFADFQMSPSFIGKRSSEIFLIVDLFEQPDSPRTSPVDPKSGWFNSRLEMTCKNDFILTTYFGKSAVPVQLCRSRDDQVTEIGKTELLLTPFVDDRVLAFTSSVQVWNSSGKVVAKINFQVALAKPLVI
jgi:hypothetical protein